MFLHFSVRQKLKPLQKAVERSRQTDELRRESETELGVWTKIFCNK